MVGHEIDCEVGHSIDLNSLWISEATMGHEIEKKVRGLPVLHVPARFRSRDPP